MPLQIPSPTLHYWRPSIGPPNVGPTISFAPFLFLSSSPPSHLSRRDHTAAQGRVGVREMGVLMAAGARPPERGGRGSPAWTRKPELAGAGAAAGAHTSSQRPAKAVAGVEGNTSPELAVGSSSRNSHSRHPRARAPARPP
jgi:hypothetical protein